MDCGTDDWVKRRFAIGFHKIFDSIQEKRIAIYGIGKNAARVLQYSEGFHFAAVAARDHFGEMFCGRKIVPLKEAVAQSDMMIIAASLQATKIIFSRIRPHLPMGYRVMDLHGHILTSTNDTADVYWEKTLEGLKREIDAHDVISFDIFDTLLMRKTLEPHDVFEMEEQELRARGEDVPFAAWRSKAETDQIVQGYLPNFDKIYRYMRGQHHLSEATVRRWKQREWELEREVLVPRKDMVEALHYAKAHGKTVCLTTDMYFSRPKMEGLLADKGITCYDAVFVSCDFQATKGDGGLFRFLLELAGERAVLHIGDHAISDVEMPHRLGIDAFGIRKAKDLLAASSCEHVLASVWTLDDRLMLGTILARLFNSPFALARTGGKVELKCLEDLSWLCFLPFVMEYLQYIVQTVHQEKDAVLLFVSRDGWFFQKVYAVFAKRFKLPPSLYFYASRQAAYGVMVEQEADIDLLLDYLLQGAEQEMKYQLEYVFQVPFPEAAGLTFGEAVQQWGEDGVRSFVKAKSQIIFKKQEKQRRNYFKYLQSLHLERYKKIYCIDLQTKGTVAYALGKMLHRSVDLIAVGGCSMIQRFVPEADRRHLMFGVLSSISPMYLWSVLVEVLCASHEGQLAGFAEDGRPVFVPNTKYQAEMLDHMQKGLLDGMADFPQDDWMMGKLSERFCCQMLDLLDPRATEITEDVCDMFSFYDPADSRLNDRYNVLRFARKRSEGGDGA